MLPDCKSGRTFLAEHSWQNILGVFAGRSVTPAEVVILPPFGVVVFTILLAGVSCFALHHLPVFCPPLRGSLTSNHDITNQVRSKLDRIRSRIHFRTSCMVHSESMVTSMQRLASSMRRAICCTSAAVVSVTNLL